MSTNGLIGRTAAACRRLVIHAGDTVGVTSTTAAAYRGQRSASSSDTVRRSDSPIGNRGERDADARIRRRRSERQLVRRGDLAREAGDAEAIRSIGGDLEVDHAVAAVQTLDGGHLEAAQRELFGNLVGRRRHVDEITDPGNKETHECGYLVI